MADGIWALFQLSRVFKYKRKEREGGKRKRRTEEGREKEKEKESDSHPKARKLSLRIYKVSNKEALFLVMKISSFCCKSKITEDLKIK